MSWQNKAHRLIAEAALEERDRANTTKAGKARKRHQPYTLPSWADELVDCIGRGDEERAKAIFLFQHLRD